MRRVGIGANRDSVASTLEAQKVRSKGCAIIPETCSIMACLAFFRWFWAIILPTFGVQVVLFQRRLWGERFRLSGSLSTPRHYLEGDQKYTP